MTSLLIANPRATVAAGVAAPSVTGFLWNCLTPWAYLNSVCGIALTALAVRLGLRSWSALLALPVWQAFEVSIYYPWKDPGIPISIFLNPLLGVILLCIVYSTAPPPQRRPQHQQPPI